MSDDQKKSMSVDVGVSARAEIKTEIPSASSGRAVDALVDLIRPFSEKRGLKADQIRLQREDVLLEIAKRTKIRLQAEGKLPEPIPNKFLVPFLEKASLGDLEDDVILDAWANLLSSASTQFDERMVRYVSVLSEIGPNQARFMDRLARNKIGDRKYAPWTDAPLLVSDLSIAEHFREEFKEVEPSAYLEQLRDYFDLPGSIIISAVLFDNDSDFWDELETENGFGEDWAYAELETLASVSVVRHAQNSVFRVKSWNLAVEYVTFTLFGSSLYIACSGVKELMDPETLKAFSEDNE